ncbi:MAG TPA: hypothetical protein GX731_06865 [Clostridiales bacterium]|nr:hypothetical protein [Clostridiales bacterium]
MENCIHKGKEICTYDLKDNNNFYINDLVEEWKLAAAQGELICSDCGQRLYLAAGPIKEPYFAHYDKDKCIYANVSESEELRKGKRLLYNLLKKSFPDREIRARYRMANGMYTTLYVLNPDDKDIAIDYRLQYNSIEKFNERDEYYKEKQIICIYVLGIDKNNHDKQISWYENLVQKSSGLCVFINPWAEEIHLKKKYEYRIGVNRKVEYCNKSYSIEELALNSEGEFQCDFKDLCIRLEESIEEAKAIYRQSIRNKVNTELPNNIRPDILNTALDLIKEGEGHLVSERYMEYIVKNNLLS